MSTQEFASKETDALEPILRENPSRNKYVLFPIDPQYKGAFDAYKRNLSSHWVVEEIDFSKDAKKWEELLPSERRYLSHLLAFFAASDGIVNENLAENFLKMVYPPEIKQFYCKQILEEAIHSETYSTMIDQLIRDPQEKEKLFNGIDNFPSVRKKAQWAQRWIFSEEACFDEKIIAFCIVEGLFFSSSFAGIFHFKKGDRLPGLLEANEFIFKDENSHCMFAALVHSYLIRKVSPERFREIMLDAVEIELTFVDESLPENIPGLGAESMKDYVRCMANTLATKLGYEPPFPGQSHDLDYMVTIALPTKSNFFEKNAAEYQRQEAFQKGMTFQKRERKY